MKKILVAIAIVAVLVVGAVLALPAIVDAESYKAEIAAAVERRTGRALTISGPVELSVFPTLGLSVDDVSLANAPAAAEPVMARIEALTVDVALLPLLSGEIVVDSFVLRRPVVNLEIDARGNPNWALAPAEPAAPDAAAGGAGGTAGEIGDVQLGEVRIEDGLVTYTDRRTGESWRAENLDASLSLPSLDAPASLTGETEWNGRAVTLALRSGPPRDLIEGRPVAVSGTLEGPLEVSFEGEAAAGATPSGKGRFQVATESVTDAARWAGVPLQAPAGKDLGALKLSGTAAWPGALAAEGSIVFGGTPVDAKLAVAKLEDLAAGKSTPLTLSLAGQPLSLSFEGSAAAGAKPRLDGRLQASMPSLRAAAAWAGQPFAEQTAPGKLGPLELAGKLAATPQQASLAEMALRLDDIRAKGRLAAGWGGARPKIEADLTTGPLDLDPYLGPPAPDSPAAPGGGVAGTESWSDEPIDASGLRAVDAALSLAAESVSLRELALGQTRASLRLAGGKAELDLKRVDAYQGRLSGSLVLDASGQTLSVRNAITADGVALRPLLQAAAGMNKLEGTGHADWSLAASGNSERALVASLDGKGNLRAVDGAIVGVNIGAMVRNVAGAFSGQAVSEEARTDFAELAGSFTISRGVLRNDDLRLLAPLFRLSGSGTADLPARTLSYRVEPKLAATAKGQGGRFERSGLMVPVVIKGPWSNLAFAPDLSAVRPEDVVGTVEDIRKDPKAALQGLVEGLTGQRPAAPEQQPAPAEQTAPTQEPQQQEPAPKLPNPLDMLGIKR